MLSLLLLLGMQNVPAASAAATAATAPGTSAVPQRALVSVGPGLDAVWLRGGQQFSVPALRPDCADLLRVDLAADPDVAGCRAVVDLWVCGRRHERDRPFAARTLEPGGRWEKLETAMVCPGVTQAERVQLALTVLLISFLMPMIGGR